AVGSYPFDSEFSPEGDLIYTVNSYGDSVSIIKAKTGRVTKTISVGDGPSTVEFLRNGKRAYVFNGGDSNISVIDAAKKRMISTLTLPPNLYACRLTPNQKAVACSTTTGDLGVFTLKNSRLTATVNVGYEASDIDWAADNTRILLTMHNDDRVVVLSWPGLEAVHTTTVGDSPIWSDVSNDGDTLYVANYYGDSVSVIDAVDGSLDATVSVGAGCWPASVTVFPDDLRGYVPCYLSGEIVSINLINNLVEDEEGTSIYPGINDIAVDISRGTARGVVTNYEEDSVGFLAF
ncbi:MAG: hypothetical protein RLZZ319_625, partial [Actinomycetota bacterium]